MKKLLILASLIFIGLTGVAQVSVEISSGLSNLTLQRKIERQTEALLNAIQSAANRNGDINFSGINISDNAAQALSHTWNQVHFRPEDNSYVETVMTLLTRSGRTRGYQIRNIGVTMIPVKDEEIPYSRQELCIDFSKTGSIQDINFTMSNVQYANALRDAERLSDGHERMQILNWCEKFAQYYIDKDTSSLRAVFDPGALIISGKIIVGKERSTVRYTPQNVEQYLTKLKRIFAQNRYIGVDFDEYEIMRHPTKDNVYMVTLRQRWTTKNYADVGTLTLIWDFSDEDFPRIQVRAWQPLGIKPFTINSIPFYD